MSDLIGYLDEIGVLEEEKLESYVWETDIKTLHGLVMYLRQVIDKEYEKSEYSPFTFMPNGEISGAGGCSELSCKKRRANKFATFSAMYADRIYLQLSFITSEHMDDYDFEDMLDEDDFWYRYSLQGDLSVISIYSELIKYKVVNIVPARHTMCRNCFQKWALGEKSICDIEQIKREYEKLAKIILYQYDNKKEEAFIQIRGVDEFFPNHDAIWPIDDIEGIKILKKEKVGQIIKNREYARALISEFIKNELVSACYLAKYCNEQGAKLITDKESDAMFLGINEKVSTMREVGTYLNGLPEYDMPLIGNLRIADVLRLRTSESEAFDRYREALKLAIIEQQKNEDDINLHQIYDDILYPELHRLDEQIRKAKTGKLKMLFGGMLVFTSSVVVNRYGNIANTGLLSNMNDLELALLNGGVSWAFSKVGATKREPKDNDYYFLWKLKKRVERI